MSARISGQGCYSNKQHRSKKTFAVFEIAVSDVSLFNTSVYADTLNMDVSRSNKVELHSIENRIGKMDKTTATKASGFDAA